MEESPPSPRLARVLDDLEVAFEAGLRRQADQEAVAAVRAGLGETVLWQQLARLAGSEVTVHAGSRLVHGVLLARYPDFFALRSADGAEHLVALGPAVTLA